MSALDDATIVLPDGSRAVPVAHHQQCHDRLKAALVQVKFWREFADRLEVSEKRAWAEVLALKDQLGAP